MPCSPAFELLVPDLKADSEGIARWKEFRLVVAGSPCTAPTLKDAALS